MKDKFVVIIQCDIAKQKCSGFACTEAFYEKSGKFHGYGDNMKYISFTCGGCCGKASSAKLMHFLKRVKKSYNIENEDIILHLSSCMTNDNFHYDRCPHIDYIKSIIDKRGIKNVIEGTYISKSAENLREKGIYKKY